MPPLKISHPTNRSPPGARNPVFVPDSAEFPAKFQKLFTKFENLHPSRPVNSQFHGRLWKRRKFPASARLPARRGECDPADHSERPEGKGLDKRHGENQRGETKPGLPGTCEHFSKTDSITSRMRNAVFQGGFYSGLIHKSWKIKNCSEIGGNNFQGLISLVSPLPRPKS